MNDIARGDNRCVDERKRSGGADASKARERSLSKTSGSVADKASARDGMDFSPTFTTDYKTFPTVDLVTYPENSVSNFAFRT